jgi:hypothetical protein
MIFEIVCGLIMLVVDASCLVRKVSLILPLTSIQPNACRNPYMYSSSRLPYQVTT